MNLGIFLSPGESFTQMKQSGQDTRFINTYLKKYAQNFQKIYVFSYENEKVNLPANVILVTNNTHVHRLIYALFLPLIHRDEIGRCNVVRGFGLASSISSLFLTKPFAFNWAYDYVSFVKMQNKFLYVPFYLVLEMLAFFKARKVFIATKSKFNELSGEKFIYLPNGVDTQLFRPTAHAKKGLIFVGRFEKQKNLFFLISTISLLPKHLRNITMVGSGSQERKLRVLANKKKVKLSVLHPVANNKLPKLLNRFSIFLLPSLHEGSPKVLLEAMATGLVPLVTKFSTASEVIDSGKNGFIESFNREDFASKIKLLLSDQVLYTKMSRLAVSKIKKDFNQEKLLQREISVLKNV